MNTAEIDGAPTAASPASGPRSVWDVLGQAPAEAQLQRAVAHHRLGHTMIFAGPEGVGKFRTALALAKTCLCDHPVITHNAQALPNLPPGAPIKTFCNHCEACHAVDGGVHPDVHVITRDLIRYHDRGGKSKGTTLSIQVIRGEITGNDNPDAPAEAKIYKRPARGPSKWFIIDEAHLMEIPAQNSLLKTLEEPPPNSYLVLLTVAPEDLLSTIRSRSQVVPFHPLPEKLIAAALSQRGLPADTVAVISHIAQGSLGAALKFSDDLTLIEKENEAADKPTKKPPEKPGAKTEDKRPFTPGGVVAWSAEIARLLDALISGRTGATALAEALLGFSGEFADLALLRDPLASKDRAARDGLILLLRIAADHLATHLRRQLAAGADTEACDCYLELIEQARQAESQIDRNAHIPMALAALTHAWESCCVINAVR